MLRLRERGILATLLLKLGWMRTAPRGGILAGKISGNVQNVFEKQRP
jgi:hypothetical protein